MLFAMFLKNDKDTGGSRKGDNACRFLRKSALPGVFSEQGGDDLEVNETMCS